MADEKYEAVYAVLSDKGATGVNDLAKALGWPLSSTQKYLERQTYFKKTESRKWDLPEKVLTEVKSDTLSLMANGVENSALITQSQLIEVGQSLELMLIAVQGLKKGIQNYRTPVAEKSVSVDLRLVALDKKAKDTLKVIKTHIDNVPDEYRDMLLNMDILGYMIDHGVKTNNDLFNTEVTSLLTGQADNLSEDTLSLVKEYQRGAK